MTTAQQLLATANERLCAGKLDEAAALCGRILAEAPHHAPAHLLLGTIRRRGNDIAGALECYRSAVEEDPSLAEAHVNLASAYRVSGALDQATAHYRAALQLRPDWPEVRNALGLALADAGRSTEAVDSFNRAILLKPDYVDAMMNAGRTLLDQGELDEARQWFSRALSTDPTHAQAHSNLLICLNYDRDVDGQRLLDEHRVWAERHAGGIVQVKNHENAPDPGRRLRIGYVSPDFYRHPVASFTEPILTNHDHDAVEVVCYADVERPDDVTGRLRLMVDTWHDTRGISDSELFARIQHDRIDILIDLTGHMADNRLLVFARKPAPVQVSYLGYPATTGLRAIDCKLTDDVCVPLGEESLYAEQVTRLSPSFCCYTPPLHAPNLQSPPSRDSGHVTFGSMHTLARLNDEVLSLWAEVLCAVPGSRLLIFRTTLTPRTQERVSRFLEERGIDVQRVQFRNTLPADGNYLSVYHQIDIALDTFPWSGHTTACEAMWMGVPVVTLAGQRASSRTVSSVLQAMGLGRLSARDKGEYVALCRSCAADAGGLEMLHASLRETMRASVLCDGKTFARGFENALREMWRTWCRTSSRQT